MIKAKILKINLNTGIGECELENSKKVVLFNVLNLQNGSNTNIYNLKENQLIFFSEDAINDVKIDAPYYLEDLDEKLALAKQVYENYDRGPLIGDLVITNQGIKRIARVTEEIYQLGHGKPYIYNDGGASYSGGLDYPESLSNLVDSGHVETALFWTFKDTARAHNGIDFEMIVKVWKEKAEKID